MSSDLNICSDADLRKRAEQRLQSQKKSAYTKDEKDDAYHDLLIRLYEHEIRGEDLLQSIKEIEAELRHYVDLYYHAPFAYLTLDEKGIIIESDDQVSTILHQKQDQILDHLFQNFLVEDDHSRFGAFLMHILDSREIGSCEVHLDDKSITGKLIRCTGNMVYHPQRRSHVWLIAIIPISQPDNTNIRIHSRENISFFADLVEHTSHPFAVAFPNGQIRMCNTSFEALLGYTSEELSTLDWARDLTPSEWKEHELSMLKKLHRTGRPIQYEKEYIRKDGTRIPVELFVHLVTDDRGNPQYYYSFISDISKRKMSELRLKESEERFKQLAEHVDEVFWFTSLNPERVLYVNPSFEQIWGISSDELYADPRIWTDRIHPDDKNRVLNSFSAWITEKIPRYDVEYRIFNKEGKLKWIHDKGAAQVKEKGIVIQVSGIAKDITYRKLKNMTNQQKKTFLET
nr:PAS domain S-box protein [uncultured Methanospirillum sp.]